MTLSHHTGVVNHVVVSGNMIYSASGDTTIKVYCCDGRRHCPHSLSRVVLLHTSLTESLHDLNCVRA